MRIRIRLVLAAAALVLAGAAPLAAQVRGVTLPTGQWLPCDHPLAAAVAECHVLTSDPPAPPPAVGVEAPVLVDRPPTPDCHPYNLIAFQDATCAAYWRRGFAEPAPPVAFVKGRVYRHFYPPTALVVLSVEKDMYNRTLVTGQIITTGTDPAFPVGLVLSFYPSAAAPAPWFPRAAS
jgi:hypothetical protein